MRHKVIACVLRLARKRREVLVFEHRDDLEAGVQIPAGTVEPGEAIAAAAYRELEEESGLTRAQVRLVAKLAVAGAPEVQPVRHVFHFAPVTALPGRWSHTVRGSGEDAEMVFDFYWLAIGPGLKLAGGQERFLHRLEAPA